MSNDIPNMSQTTQLVHEDLPIESYNFIWNVNSLAWEKATGAITGAGNVVTVNNFPQVQPVNDNSGSLTVDSPQLPSSLVSGRLDVNVGNTATVSVSNFPAIQPISAASLPLPSNAAKETGGNLDTLPNLLLDTTFTTRTNTLGQKTSAASMPVVISSNQSTIPVDGSGVTQPISGSVSVSNFPATQPVSGTVTANQGGTWTVQPGNTANTTAWKVDGSAVTQPVSAASLPLPSGASQEHTTAGSPSSARLTDGTSFYKGTTPSDTQPVSGTFWQTTQPVSAAALPLPSGAATLAKQPALGTAGTASVDVITVQGITSMTPLKTDGSGVTQPISGSVTANAGTNLNTSALALEAGHLATIDSHIPTQGQTTMSASLPVVIANNQSAIPVTGTFFQGTQPISGTVNTKTVLTPSAPTVAAVGTSSASAVAANGSRKGLMLRNLSTSGQRVSLGFANTAVLDSGVTLYAQDSYYMSEYDFNAGVVNAISSGSSGSLSVQEYS